MEQINIISSLSDYNPIPAGYTIPEAPYVVVRPEKDPLARGVVFRITAHDLKNQVFRLNETMIAILDILSENEKLSYQSEDFDPTVNINNDDGTISREHTFLMFEKF